ncbi:TetR/AcrR family transcriptional regulator [Agromyces sp. SYSU K20354]|nr:TetR/AcrR family transcriptional regulator [Agromyces cavernae]
MRRDGASALTMQRLASEAGCAVGLIYKVFADREELMIEIAVSELGDLGHRMAAWAAESGTRTISENLDAYASILLDAETPALVHAESLPGERLTTRFAESAEASTFFDALGSAVTDYLGGEQRAGRVRREVDPAAFGFMIAGAIHNLLASGPGHPRPTRAQLSRYLSAVATTIESPPA